MGGKGAAVDGGKGDSGRVESTAALSNGWPRAATAAARKKGATVDDESWYDSTDATSSGWECAEAGGEDRVARLHLSILATGGVVPAVPVVLES